MSYIEFDKNQLINLEYSLTRELIRSNRAGAYASKTIIGCNTRKYHGLLVVPQPGIDHENHVLLSNLDETVIQRGAEFNLGIHQFPGGVYHPKGHRYMRDFGTDPIPHAVYRVGGVVLKREMLFLQNNDRVLLKYTLLDAHSPTRLRLKPFLAYRNVHHLSRANMHVQDKYERIDHGIRMRLYPGYSMIYMQVSKPAEYTHVPDWFYNIEYQEEMRRGYNYQEDLFVPGFFEFPLRKNESVIFSAGIKQAHPQSLKRSFSTEVKRRIPRDNYENCLINSAQQFIVKKGNKTEIVAGYPWFGRWGRDTFISMPGLTLVLGDLKTGKAVIDTMISDLKGPLFPNIGSGQESAYNSVDAPLWFFWALQQYAAFSGDHEKIWKSYGKKMKLVLEGFRKGTDFGIEMQDNGLLHAGEAGYALTWMDAVVNGKPVTPRQGLAVEINALWYNAICFSLEVAEKAGDSKFVKQWAAIAGAIPKAFEQTFWNKEKQYLADYVDNNKPCWCVRPNQIFAVSLPYSPVNEEIQQAVVEKVRQELLTPRGLRTLSPKNPNYKGTYEGDQKQRDNAYHQGTVWPWLLGHFAEAYLKMHGHRGLALIEELYHGFEEVMTEAGIGTISEIYHGDPPHQAVGAISQAWSVAELLRIKHLIDKYKE
jgi:predicted glycogen debranching enzyme